MSKFTTGAVATAALIGSLFIADTLEAAKPRNPVERRQRPSGGFWEKSTPSRSYSSNRSIFFNASRLNSLPLTNRRSYVPSIVRSAPSSGTAGAIIHATPSSTSQPRIVSERVISVTPPSANRAVGGATTLE